MLSFNLGPASFDGIIRWSTSATEITVWDFDLRGQTIGRTSEVGVKVHYDLYVGGKKCYTFDNVTDDLSTSSYTFLPLSGPYSAYKTFGANIAGGVYPRGNVSSSVVYRVTGFVRFYKYDNGVSYYDLEFDSSGYIDIPAKSSYKITYDANGGNGAPAQQTKGDDETITIPSQKPTRTGYDFAGWEGSDGTTYQPGDSYSGNSSLTLVAIWGAVISFVGNGGGNVPAAIPKPKDTAVTIPDIIPTKAGYIFLSWNTASGGGGTTYSPGGVISASINTSLTLYAQWLKGPDPPTIDKLSTVRCDSQGKADNDGEYCLVTCQWHIDTTNIRNNTATVTGTIAQQNSSQPRSFAFESGYSGTSGTATAILEGMDTDMQYTVTVRVTDKKTFSELSSILTRARFILDFKPGGFGMGIGSAAPTTGLEIGWDVQFDGDVNVLGRLTTTTSDYSKTEYTGGTDPTSSEIFDATGSYASDRVTVQRMGKLIQVNIVVSANETLAAGERDNIGTLSASISPIESIGFANRDVSGYISAGGSISVIAIKDWSGATEISAMYFGKE